MSGAVTVCGQDIDSLKANLASGKPVKIICFGDSVTGLYYHTGGRRTYTDMLGFALRKSFSNANVTMRNAGISGNTTTAGLKRIERDVLAHKPDLVTVMFGLNDMVRVPLETYRKNLEEMVDRCREGGARVILCTPNAVVDTSSRPTGKLLQYCTAVRKVAQSRKVSLCDTYVAFDELRKRDRLTWRLMMSDEIHPNMAGHKFIAEEIARAIFGKAVSIADVAPPVPAIPKVKAMLKNDKTIRVLAMPPFDKLIKTALTQEGSMAAIEVISWATAGQSLKQLERDAQQRVRKMKPDLVVIAVPRDAAFASQEEFIRATSWIMNWSLSFGRQEWDCVVIHPSVAEGKSDDLSRDDLIRRLVAAQDLSLIDRDSGDRASAAEISGKWFRVQLALP